MGRSRSSEDDGCALGCVAVIVLAIGMALLDWIKAHPTAATVLAIIGGCVVVAAIVIRARSSSGPRLEVEFSTGRVGPRSTDRGYRFELSATDDGHDRTTIEVVIRDAARRRHAVSLRYQKPDAPEITERIVEPYHIMQNGQRGKRYLLCRQVHPPIYDGGDWRTFRLDRVVAAREESRTYTPVEEVTIGTGRTFRYNAP